MDKEHEISCDTDLQAADIIYFSQIHLDTSDHVLL